MNNNNVYQWEFENRGQKMNDEERTGEREERTGALLDAPG